MNDSLVECQDNIPEGVCVVLKPCCTKRCIAKFSMMEMEDAQKKWGGFSRQQQRQYLLDSLSTCCTKEVSWKEATFQFLVSVINIYTHRDILITCIIKKNSISSNKKDFYVLYNPCEDNASKTVSQTMADKIAARPNLITHGGVEGRVYQLL